MKDMKIKRIKYLDPSHNILNTNFVQVKKINTNLGINLFKDSDKDGKPNWIDCRPYNAKYQDKDDTNILTKEDSQDYEGDTEEKKQVEREEREIKNQEREEKRQDRELERQDKIEKREVSRLERELKKGDTAYKIREHERERTVGGRITKAVYRLAKDATKSYKPAQKTAKQLRQNLRSGVRLRSTRLRSTGGSTGGRTFMAPQGQDISLSSSIAQANWSGERNVMNTEFFGGSSQSKDLLGEGERRDRELVSNRNAILGKRKEMDFLGNSRMGKAIDVFGTNKNKSVEFISSKKKTKYF